MRIGRENSASNWSATVAPVSVPHAYTPTHGPVRFSTMNGQLEVSQATERSSHSRITPGKSLFLKNRGLTAALQ